MAIFNLKESPGETVAEKTAMDRRSYAGMKNVNGDRSRTPIIYSSVTPLVGLSTLPFFE
jgi:hypothetical protein